MTIMFTPAGSNLTYVTPEIAALSNGYLVAVWDQIGPSDTTWTVAGQIVTADGTFVGSQFTIPTALPSAATPGRPSIDALPNGDFVVVYSAAAGSLSGQKYGTSGNPIGDPFGVTNSSSGNAATTVLSDGTLLPSPATMASSARERSPCNRLARPGAARPGPTWAPPPTGSRWRCPIPPKP